uniref:Mitochondrial inner membrane protein MPV17 n=1 Tax=Chelydra serpentina TaxID=8475 RepID=A0A8C3SQ37_CHESE
MAVLWRSYQRLLAQHPWKVQILTAGKSLWLFLPVSLPGGVSRRRVAGRLSMGQAPGLGIAGWSEPKGNGASWVSRTGAGTLLAAACARGWGDRQRDRLSAAAGQLSVVSRGGLGTN